MKKFLKILICVALGATLSLADILKVGTNANFPPFEFIDDNAKITGFDIELIDALTKEAGLEYEVINMGFDALIPALKSGKIDVAVSGMSATPERKKAVDFTTPYYNTQNLFMKKADNDSINSKDDMKDKILATQLGTVQETASRQISKNVLVNKEPFGAVMAVKKGKADVLVLDASVGYGYLKNNPDLIEFYKEDDGSDGFAMAFDKGKYTETIKKLDDALEAIKANGIYDQLLEKYELK